MYDEVKAAKDVFIRLISTYPDDEIIHTYMSGGVTAKQVKDSLQNGGDLGSSYCYELLEFCRDMLRRKAKALEKEKQAADATRD